MPLWHLPIPMSGTGGLAPHPSGLFAHSAHLQLYNVARTAMSMALRNLNLMRALPKEAKKLIRSGPRSPRNAARIANASIPPRSEERRVGKECNKIGRAHV